MASDLSTQTATNTAAFAGKPAKQGLYNPSNERDACGVGFVAHIKGNKSHDIVQKGLELLTNLTHRGATGYDPKLGDGAGLLMRRLYRKLNPVATASGSELVDFRLLNQREVEPGRYQVAMMARNRKLVKRFPSSWGGPGQPDDAGC